jgi:hypothetical protein
MPSEKIVFKTRVLAKNSKGEIVCQTRDAEGDRVEIEGYEGLDFAAVRTKNGKWMIVETARGRGDYSIVGDTKEEAISKVKSALSAYSEAGEDFRAVVAHDSKALENAKRREYRKQVGGATRKREIA